MSWMWPSIGSELKPHEKCCGQDVVKTFWLTVGRRSSNNSAVICLITTLSTKYSTCIARKLNCILSRWEAVIWPAEIQDSQSHLLEMKGDINHLATVSVSSTLTVMCQSPSTTEVGSASQDYASSRFPFDAGFFFCGAFVKLQKVTFGFLLAWNNSAHTGRIFMKFNFECFCKICRENSSLMKILQK
jgi:hypothetical protein